MVEFLNFSAKIVSKICEDNFIVNNIAASSDIFAQKYMNLTVHRLLSTEWSIADSGPKFLNGCCRECSHCLKKSISLVLKVNFKRLIN